MSSSKENSNSGRLVSGPDNSISGNIGTLGGMNGTNQMNDKVLKTEGTANGDIMFDGTFKPQTHLVPQVPST